MAVYPIHDAVTAPAAAKPALQGLQAAFGFIPNVAGAMANSPMLINCLAAVFGQVHAGGFTELQVQTLLLTNAVTNACPWAVAFHSTLALSQGLAQADVEAVRVGGLPEPLPLAALSRLAKTLIAKRGQLDEKDQRIFLQAGYSPTQLLDVIAVVAASTITNYTASVTKPPLEAAFQPNAWAATVNLTARGLDE